MSRLPFDPSRMTPREKPAAQASEVSPLTVTQLASLVERALGDNLPATIRVIGEIGQFRERTHWYFDLKDQDAVISCVMFASAARKVGFVPRVGQQVVLSGRVEFYGRQGRTQFMAEKLQPVGEGALDAAFRRLCEELRGLGWFADERKRRLPVLPRRVAVLTSRSGAALQDVLDTARRRCPSVPIALIDARVQGEGAAAQLAQAVRRLSAVHRKL
ncbi:MAG: exodeoxyribonuclease VII large subunit, partial [Phycisphaerales bacterium]